MLRVQIAHMTVTLHTVQGKTFEGENFWRIGENTTFAEKTFCCAKGHYTPKFCRENFCEQPRNREIHKVFSLESFPLPSILRLVSHTVDVRLTISVWKLWCLSSSHHSYQVGSAKHLRMHHTAHHLKICVRRGLKEECQFQQINIERVVVTYMSPLEVFATVIKIFDWQKLCLIA